MVPLEISAPLALSFLFQRLKWPVPMARWRTAKAIRNLLNNPDTRALTVTALYDYFDHCGTESETCTGLTIIFLTSVHSRPSLDALATHLNCPSILGDMILDRTYGTGSGAGAWRSGQLGPAPQDFVGGSYFEEHKTAHVPPIFMNNLVRLERTSGHPFLRQWAYEWKVLRDKLGTPYTRYPHYFDDVSEVRAGIMGQYWQRMREVFISAYLRTLAHAVTKWGMPQTIAESYCTDSVEGITGLFDVEPDARPSWLLDFPERICVPGADVEPIIRELTHVAREDGMCLVSLDTPIAANVHKYAKMTISAHLVTPDYEIPDGAILYEKMAPLVVERTFELAGAPATVTLTEARTPGKTGDEVSVCTGLFPIPFGCWQGDYFSVGLTIPAPYTTGDAEIRCNSDGIDLIDAGGRRVSRTRIWNDDWAPPHPKGGSPRCGVATMLDTAVLNAAQERLSRKLAWFAKVRIWERAKEYGEYAESRLHTFILD